MPGRSGDKWDFGDGSFGDLVLLVDQNGNLIALGGSTTLAAGAAVVGKVGFDPASLTMAHTVATATGASSAMLAANGARKYALLVNDGAVDVYIKIGAAAVAHEGIVLKANGGSYEMGAAFGNLSTAAVNGIPVSGSAVVMSTEGV